MDRSLDTAAWENFSHKPDLIHLSCWQPEAHQASSWLFASSKRLTPRRSPEHPSLWQKQGPAQDSPVGEAYHGARMATSSLLAQQVHGEIQTPSSGSKRGGPGSASPYCFQNYILLETNSKAATVSCRVLLGEPIGPKAQFHVSRLLSQCVYYDTGDQPTTSGTPNWPGTKNIKESLPSPQTSWAGTSPLLEC